jgi:hypothetical protein
MAFSVVETKIANPARRRSGKGRKKNMARRRKNLSAKQIRFFGTPAQKAALKRSRAAKRGAKKRTTAHRHRPRTKKRHSPRANPSPRRMKKRATAKRSSHRRRTKKASAKRRNPVPQIISWVAGNPAKRRKKSMARHRTKKRRGARRSNAGTTRRRSTKRVMHHRRRHNPAGLGRPMDWVTGGAGVLAGGVGSRMIPQLLMGASNTGMMGYAANAAAAIGLGFLAHTMFPRQPILTVTVIAGGFGGLISRIVSDRTSFGAALSLTGLGDWGLGLYQKSNFNNPQRIVAPRGPNSSMFTWGAGDQNVPSMMTAGSDSSLPC